MGRETHSLRVLVSIDDTDNAESRGIRPTNSLSGTRGEVTGPVAKGPVWVLPMPTWMG